MIPRWIVTRVKISRWIVTPGHDSTLNCDPGSWFHVELWSKVKLWHGIGMTIQCVILTRVIIQRGILTRGHNSTWNSDPSTYLLPVELRPKKVSKFNSVIKIQQLRRVTIQRKIHWILTPGRYSIGGSKFYLTPDQMSDRKYKNIHLVDETKKNTSDHRDHFRPRPCAPKIRMVLLHVQKWLGENLN